MLTKTCFESGVSLVELIVALTIVGFLFGVAVPNFKDWIISAQIRTAAEATLSGLQLARAEAARRNTQVMFQFMDTATNACALSTTGTNWVISLSAASGKCATTPADPPLPPTVQDPANPYIIQARSSAEGSSLISVSTNQANITFNGLGRLNTSPAASVTINFSSPSNGTCKSGGGSLRCLRVTVTSSGQIRMCDPAVTSATDMRICQ